MPESSYVRPFKKIGNSKILAITVAALTPVQSVPATRHLMLTNITDAVAFIAISDVSTPASVPVTGNTTGADVFCVPSMKQLVVHNPAPGGYISTIAGSAPSWGTVVITGGEGQI